MHRTDRGIPGCRMHAHPARAMGRKPSCTGAPVRRESTAAFQDTEDRKVKTRSLFLAGAVLMVIAAGINAQQKTSQDLTWAFPQLVAAKELKPVEDDGKPRRVPGSNKEYTQKQIDEFFNAPDWFPEEHPPLPKTVQFGKSPRVQACGKCHLINGQGHPESAGLAGLSAAYMIRQMAELQRDIRKNAEPMNIYAKNFSVGRVGEERKSLPSLSPGWCKRLSKHEWFPRLT